MEFKDYYQIMGVKRDASQEEIKRAYRKLSRKYHPDVSDQADATARFQELGEAYEVLRDPEKRAAYDRLGANWKSGQEFHPPPDWDSDFEFRGGGFNATHQGNYSDFFEQLFGHGEFAQHFATHAPRHKQTMRGQDHHAKILIDLEDSFTGASRNITLTSPELTQDGRLINRQRSLKVQIPRGIRSGQQIRLSGQGEPGIGNAPAGDLYLEVKFKPHRYYRVEEQHLYLDLPVTPWEAALGASVKVPTPSGPVDLTIPAASQQGRKLRLKGRGLGAKNPGDLYVVLQIRLPAADSDEAKKIYQMMREKLNFNPRQAMMG
jgi:curved DNA-binding protein